MYKVFWKRKVDKEILKMPKAEQKLFIMLVDEIRESGPIRTNWRNFSKLTNTKDTYHCHLSYHWIAVWRWNGISFEVEVTYAGNREKSAY